MFPQARNIVAHSSGLSRLRLLAATASYSRPWFAGLCSVFLRSSAREGKLAIHYRTNNQRRKMIMRLEHLQSDLCSALELAVSDCYCLERLNAPEFVVDGGGNTGLFTLAASARWPTAQFIICEPVPANLEILRENLALNGLEAQVMPVCLGATPGLARFFCREANQGSFSPDLPFRAVIDVEVRTLSEVCRGHEDERTLVKLDIEGAEISVLEEFLRVRRARTTIVGELHQHTRQKPVLCALANKTGWTLQFLREDTQCSQFQMFSPDQAPKSTNPAIDSFV